MASALLIGKNHRLQHVHHLGNVRHLHTIGILMEDIE